MSRVSQKSLARYGIPINCRVKKEVGQAIIAEGLRTRRSTGHTAAMILEYWYLDDFLPMQKEKK